MNTSFFIASFSSPIFSTIRLCVTPLLRNVISEILFLFGLLTAPFIIRLRGAGAVRGILDLFSPRRPYRIAEKESGEI